MNFGLVDGELPAWHSCTDMSGTVSAFPLSPGDRQAQRELEELLASKSCLYPDIVPWFRRKVLPELGTPARHVWAIWRSGSLVGEAILKLDGRGAKLCSMFLDPGIRGVGVGDLVLAQILGRARRCGAGEIHFTIGEDTAPEHTGYFERVGFHFACWRQGYRRGVREMVYAASPAAADSALLGILRQRACADKSMAGADRWTTSSLPGHRDAQGELFAFPAR